MPEPQSNQKARELLNVPEQFFDELATDLNTARKYPGANVSTVIKAIADKYRDATNPPYDAQHIFAAGFAVGKITGRNDTLWEVRHDPDLLLRLLLS